jgi:acyl carrier protein phosphodiesterase
MGMVKWICGRAGGVNYIAHIHLAHVTNTSMLGNFLGDFVKGSRLEHLPDDIRLGIQLHRSIDSFTDRHAQIVGLRELFPAALRRMSGIVIDIYFDHLLCLHWQSFTEQDLRKVLPLFYQEMDERSVAVAGRFLGVKQGLLTHQWLSDYVHRGSCLSAFHQIEKRLNFRIEFARQADQFLIAHHADFERTFLRFYPELITYAKFKLANDLT